MQVTDAQRAYEFIIAQLDKDAELERLASNGPWTYNSGNREVDGKNRENICDLSMSYRTENGDKFTSPIDPWHDGEFIAHARNHAKARNKAMSEMISYMRAIYGYAKPSLKKRIEAGDFSKEDGEVGATHDEIPFILAYQAILDAAREMGWELEERKDGAR